MFIVSLLGTFGANQKDTFLDVHDNKKPKSPKSPLLKAKELSKSKEPSPLLLDEEEMITKNIKNTRRKNEIKKRD